MDNIINGNDIHLLNNDKYTFFVLGKVMYGNCKMIYTDHKNFIICYVDDIHPIWIWTKDGINKNNINKNDNPQYPQMYYLCN